ncbi:MAG: hypothetical protein AB1393_07505 [Candidatus Edwardsbacteria bacterium]
MGHFILRWRTITITTLVLNLSLGLVFSTLTDAFSGLIFGFNLLSGLISLLVLNMGILFLGEFCISSEKEEFEQEAPLVKDLPFLLPIMVLVLIVIFVPLNNVGKKTVDGEVIFPCFFNLDLFKNMVHTAAISSGELPPANFYFNGESLHYYWFYFVFPAFVYQLSFFSASIKDILILHGIFVDLLFVLVLFSLLSLFIKKKSIVFFLLLIALFFSGFEGARVIFLVSKGVPLDVVSNVEGLRFPNLYIPEIYPHIEGFYRYFLYIQVALLGLCLFLSTIILHKLLKEKGEKVIIPWCIFAILLCSIPGFSLVMGILAVVWFLLYIIWEHIRLQWVWLLPLFFLPFFYLMYSHIEIFFPSVRLLTISQLKIFLSLFIHFIWEFGPVFICGILGLFIIFQKSNFRNYLSLFILGLISLGILCVLSEKEMLLGTLPSWEGNIIFHISVLTSLVARIFLVFSTGILLQHILCKWHKAWLSILVGILIFIPAFPTVLVDIYFHSKVKKENTTYVSHSTFSACEWIKKNTPKNAVFQSATEYPGATNYAILTTYSPITTFGERKLSCGHWGYVHVYVKDKSEINRRYEMVEELFTSKDIERTKAISYALSLNYIYTGEREHRIYGKILEKFKGVFPIVYDKDSIFIYKVENESYNRKFVELNLAEVANTDYHLNVFLSGQKEGRSSFPGLRKGIILWHCIPFRIPSDFFHSGKMSVVNLSLPTSVLTLNLPEKNVSGIYLAFGITGFPERDTPFLRVETIYDKEKSSLVEFICSPKGISSKDKIVSSDTLYKLGEVFWESDAFGFVQKIRGIRIPLQKRESMAKRVKISRLSLGEKDFSFGFSILAITLGKEEN